MLSQGPLSVEGDDDGDSVSGMRCEDSATAVLALKMEEGAMNQGMWAASRSWERQGNGFSLELPEGMGPSRHLDSSPMRPISDLIHLCCFKPLSWVEMC